jgi:hypothetical protein
MPDRPFIWIDFGVFVVVMLALDLGVFHRKSHEVSLKEALAWSAVWIGLALIFNAAIYYRGWRGEGAAILHRLCGGTLPECRQPVRVPTHLRLFQSARTLPA